jgi:site-specific recombinase XerD
VLRWQDKHVEDDMELDNAVTAYFYSLDLTPSSRLEYSQKMRAFVSWLTGHTCALHPQPVVLVDDIDTNHMREFIESLRGITLDTKRTRPNRRPMGPNTIHGYARVIKAFMNWAIREELVAEVVTKRFRMPKREQKVIQVFTREQVFLLLGACERRYDSMYRWLEERDKAMLYVLLDTGVRRRELINLTLGDITFDKEDPHILVHGKGRKDREVGLGVAARNQLHRYVYRFRPKVESDVVFLTRDRRPIDIKGVDNLIYQLRVRTQLKGVRVSAHTFRHTFAYNYLNSGGDVFKLSRLLGHTSLVVTEGYLRCFNSREARKGKSVLDEMMNSR